MQTATTETESKSLDLSVCVHHYTLREPCPKGQGIESLLFEQTLFWSWTHRSTQLIEICPVRLSPSQSDRQELVDAHW